MSYYIRGNKTRGAEVIKLLESKGGINKWNIKGNNAERYYFINKNNIILVVDSEDVDLLRNFCEELTLPEKTEWKPKFKVGDTVKILPKLSSTNETIGIIKSVDIKRRYYEVLTKESMYHWAEEYLNLYEWSPKRGETVLVKAGASCEWEEAVFSYSTEHSYHTVGGESWNKIYCIPFNINKLGKITEE